MGLDLDMDVPPLVVGEALKQRYLEYRQRRDERAANAEIRDVLQKAPRFQFHPDDEVRLVRRIDNKRVIQGPFTIEAVHPDNRYLYKLYGKPNYVSVGQLLPFREDVFMKEFDYAVQPHQALLARITTSKVTGGVPFPEIRPGQWIFVIREAADFDKLAPSHQLSLSLVEKVEGNSLTVLGLDRCPDDIFGDAFTCTAHKRIPKRVKDWLESTGVSSP
ncbi:hypothetical protein FOZ61_010065 [Perkinsus olseni]|uniref:Uncharacterized protein n=1 Tax=Perkinsus olseni TaxID=32597 RepID=A0A7J6KZP4_PEROL|nr:hypothetical protein FOZ61_010065 [Perkinsus olseni]